MDNIDKYKLAIKKQRLAALLALGLSVDASVATALPYGGGSRLDTMLNTRRFNDVKLSKNRILKLRKLMGTDVAVSLILRAAHPLMYDYYNNAFYMGINPLHVDQVDPLRLKKHILYPFYFKDYDEWDSQTDLQLLNKGTVVLGGRSGLGTLAHELGHAKDRQDNPDKFFAEGKLLDLAQSSVAKGLAIGGGLGLAGSLALLIGGLSTNNEPMAMMAGIPLALGLVIGGTAGSVSADTAMQQAYKSRQLSLLRASQYAMQALQQMRLKPAQVAAIRDSLNAALKTYGVLELV